MQNCFKLQTPLLKHLLRTQLSPKLHFSSSHRKIPGCILLDVTLRLILHFSSLLCEDTEPCRGVLQNCPSGVLLTEQIHWHLLYKSMQPRTYQCWYFLNFYSERDRSHSVPFPSCFIRLAIDFAPAWLQILFWPNTSLDTPYSTSAIQTPSNLALTA